jgi:MFS transporter, DHA1 family, inner membrane transport protein
MPSAASRARIPAALYALTIGAFGIGTTEFVIMGLLQQVAGDLGVSITSAGLLISGYALGVFVGAPVLTLATAKLPRKAVLVALMGIFTLGNLACALAPDYATLMAARVLTSLAHGTFFGVGAVVATSLVPAERRASAISLMFAGLTVATVLGVPAGAWLGLHHGWRATFWAVSAIGVLALAAVALWVPARVAVAAPLHWREEVAVLKRGQVLLALLMTAVGIAGEFAVFTYIQPLLVTLTGFSQDAVSGVLLVFGVGMVIGNLLGGRLADRHPDRALIGTLAAMALVLLAMPLALHSPSAMVVMAGLLGVSSFATVAPLQLRVLEQARGAGQNLASSLNIAAFNLGNALGAWIGGVVVASSAGLAGTPWAAAALTVLGLLVAVASVRHERRQRRRAALASCTQAA